jgi:16S rRNA (cytidine1402-2'-O)-methyltransferase
VVATPIGNLADITERARQVLSTVDFIAVEDSRHSRSLLNHLQIHKPMVSLHEHNERQRYPALLERIKSGESMALISDAGTPLISDPGYHLVKHARQQGIAVIPIPGACALVAALSVSGLPTDHFRFEGFLPPKQAARRSRLEQLIEQSCTLVFYESSHRIKACIADMVSILGAEREAVLARELTKMYETIIAGTLADIATSLEQDTNQTRGEFVVMIKGLSKSASAGVTEEARMLLQLLLKELPLKTATSVVSKYFNLSKNEVYQTALAIKNEQDSSS